MYLLTEKFPASEKFGIVNQIRRTSVSICSNLAEGCGRNTSKDQGHFYNLAYSSLMELLNQLLNSFELQWIKEDDIFATRSEIEIISMKINALRKSILKT